MSEATDRQGRERRRWAPAEKARLVRRHLQEGVSLADLADESGAAPGQLSQWCKQALEGLEAVFSRTSQREEKAAIKELAGRDFRIRQLQEVVTELSEEVLRLKKASGANSVATMSRPR